MASKKKLKKSKSSKAKRISVKVSTPSKAKKPARTKETVRVKTFIVEKPVYVSAEGEKPLSLREKYSKFFKEKILRKNPAKLQEAQLNEDPLNDDVDSDEELAEKEQSEEYANEEAELNDPNAEFDEEPLAEVPQEHVRSQGLFNNVWWKKAVLKGFLAWLVIVVFAYVLQLFKLADVQNAANWFFLLLLSIALFLVFEKFLAGKVKV